MKRIWATLLALSFITVVAMAQYAFAKDGHDNDDPECGIVECDG